MGSASRAFLSPTTPQTGDRPIASLDGLWPELEDLYSHVTGVLVERDEQGYRARAHLPVRRALDDGEEVQAHPVGPTFRGHTPGQAYRACEEWVYGYLDHAYKVSFRVRRLDQPFFGPSHFVGVRTYTASVTG